MTVQQEIFLPPFPRGFHLITDHVSPVLKGQAGRGVLHLFICHTSAGLTINENHDPDVRADLGTAFDKLVKENENWYTHILEGPDDMPAHIKSTLVGSSLMIPFSGEKLLLGTWQGIYLCEFRNNGGARKCIATVVS